MLTLLGSQEPGRDPRTFTRRAAEFALRDAQLKRAAGTASGAAALAWLRALRNVLEAIPIARASGPHEQWVKRHESLIVYSEPAGQWLISNNLLDDIHAEYAKSAAADEIAWLAVTNGLPGECEGYVPCYVSSLNTLEGTYLRRHPRGAHRNEAFDLINQSLRSVLDDLLKRPEREDYLKVPADCGDLLATARPLGAAVAGANGAKTETMGLLDRLMAQCPKP